MTVYIRHGNDDQEKTTFAHDNKLNLKAISQINRQIPEIIKKYGVPDVILLSPFHRVRYTVIEMMKYFKNNRIRVKYMVEPRLGRYFNYNEQKRPEVRGSTKYYKPYIKETVEAFNYRVKRQFNSVKNRFRGKKVWCITHALVINEMLEIHRRKTIPNIRFLECFSF